MTAAEIEANHKDGVLALAIQKPAAVRATKIKIGDGSGKDGLNKGGFLKSFIGDKKGGKDTAVEVKQETGAMTN